MHLFMGFESVKPLNNKYAQMYT